MKEIFENIAKNANSNNFTSCLGKVISVNSDNTCDVNIVNDDNDAYDVRFRAKIGVSSGFYAKPKNGSYVMVTFVNKSTGYISLYSEVDEIYCQADGESNGGVVKLNALFERLKTIETAFKNLNTLLIAHVHPSSGVVSPTLAVLPDPGTTVKNDLENKKFIH